jgi:hypothetical protein
MSGRNLFTELKPPRSILKTYSPADESAAAEDLES